MACVALNIPSAIRLIRLFNILFSLLRVETRCVERLKRRFALFFTPKQKDPPTVNRVGPFIILSHGGWPQALGRIVAAPSIMCQFQESSLNR
jgi:hypothetical protein